MAARTAEACRARMGRVPRALERRGGEESPARRARFRKAGDEETARVLEAILAEEVAHVAAGSRWFAWCCAREGRDPASTFEELVVQHLRGALRGPFNANARLAAGFTAAELARLDELAA
jgi:uncharacterized ferritin-like protein (DUF455 family)